MSRMTFVVSTHSNGMGDAPRYLNRRRTGMLRGLSVLSNRSEKIFDQLA
jgi:hypothetical protein